MQTYRVHPKSEWWTVAVQLTEVTSCRRVRLCCQFYEHNYLTSDAAKDWFVKFVTGWPFSSDSSVWRGRCLGSNLCDFGSVMLEACAQLGCAATTTTTARVLTFSSINSRGSRGVCVCVCVCGGGGGGVRRRERECLHGVIVINEGARTAYASYAQWQWPWLAWPSLFRTLWM